MTRGVISSTNLQYMRYPLSAVIRACLYPFAGQDLDKATAVISATPDPEDYPVSDYTVTGAANWSLGKRGMRVIVQDPVTLEIKNLAVLRTNNVTGYLKIAGRQPGDRGIAGFSPRNIEAGDLVTIPQYFPPYSFATRADLETLELFKRWDDAFSAVNPQTQYPRPQINIGPHIIGIADAGTGKFRVVINPARTLSGSISWNSNPITYTWSVPTGFTLVSSSGASRTYDIDGGTIGLMSVSGEDSVTGKTNIAYRYVYVEEPAMRGGLAADDRFRLAIENDRQTLTGRSMTLVISSDTRAMLDLGADYASLKTLVQEQFLPGTPVLFSYEHIHSTNNWFSIIDTNDTATGRQVEVHNYIGYVRDMPQVSATRGGVERVRINLVSPIEYTDQLLFRPQELVASETPSNWQEVHPTLSNAAYVPFYILDNHTFLNTMHDLEIGRWGSGIGGYGYTYPAALAQFEQPSWSLDGGKMLEAITGVQRTLAFANIGCDSDGSIILRRHPCYEDSDVRGDIPIVAALNELDIRAPDDPAEDAITYERDDYPTNAETMGTFLISTTDIAAAVVETAWTGLYAPEQGRETNPMADFVALDEADGQARVGHHHAVNNAPVKSITLPIHAGLDIFDPARMEWFTLTVGNSVDAHYPYPYDPLHTREFLGGYRHLVREVIREWNITPQGWLKYPTVTFIPETAGQPAPLKPQEVPSNFGEWCYTFNFQVDNGGFAVFLPTNPGAHPVDYWNGSGRGSYAAGGGWMADTFSAGGSGYGAADTGLSIKKSFASCTVSRIEAYCNIPGGSGLTFNTAVYYWETGGSEQVGTPESSYGEVNYVLDLGDGVDINAVGLHIIVYGSSLPLPALALQLTLFGVGAISTDFGDSNCGG